MSDPIYSAGNSFGDVAAIRAMVIDKKESIGSDSIDSQGTIKLHPVARRVTKEYLFDIGLLNKTNGVFDSVRFEVGFHGISIIAGECGVVKSRSDKGLPHFVRTALAQVQYVGSVRIKPVAKTAKCRPITFYQTHYRAVKIPQFI